MALRRIAYLLVGAIAVAPALAADDATRSRCLDPRNSADQRLSSCAVIVDDKMETAAAKSAAYASQGRVYVAKQEWDRAIAAFDAAIRISPHSAAYNGRGVALSKMGKYQIAIGDLTEAIRLDGRNANAFNNRAIANVELGNFEQAVDDAKQAVGLDGANPNYLNQLAWAYLRAQRPQAGLPYVDRALQLDPKHANAYDTRASIYEALGQRTLAMENFKQALSIDPSLSSSTDGLFRLAQTPSGQSSVADVIRFVQTRGWVANLKDICTEFELKESDGCQFKQVSLEDDKDGKGYPRGFNVPAVAQSSPSYVLIFHLNPLVGEFFVMSPEGKLLKAFYRSKGRGYERIPIEAVQDEFNADLRYWTENAEKVAQGLGKLPTNRN